MLLHTPKSYNFYICSLTVPPFPVSPFPVSPFPVSIGVFKFKGAGDGAAVSASSLGAVGAPSPLPDVVGTVIVSSAAALDSPRADGSVVLTIACTLGGLLPDSSAVLPPIKRFFVLVSVSEIA